MDKQILSHPRVYFGADPELFLTQNGKVIGSEKVIPEAGVDLDPYELSKLRPHAQEGRLGVIRDGVQIELNLPPTHCREWLCLEVKHAFQVLRKHLEKEPNREFQLSFRQVVEVDQVELDSLAKESRRLGCAPSFNWYNPAVTIGVDAEKYRKRSAAGHIHLGLPENLMGERERLPPLLDILLGNTAVLIDRDPDGAERRKVYGRAGEFRLPRHGIEYRTPSNFWLRASPLVSLVMGLARLAVFVLDTSVTDAASGGWAADQALLDMVDLGKVQKAINEVDVNLAKENFQAVKTYLTRHLKNMPVALKETGLCGDIRVLGQFNTFVAGIDTGGIERWFPKDPATYWEDVAKINEIAWGWERFLSNNCSRTGAL